jgi:hypothetical protein
VVESDVDRVEVVDVIEVPRLGHRFPADDLLFAGLEEHLERAVEVALEDAIEHAEAHRRVRVVAAGVHVPLVVRPEALGSRHVVVRVGLRDRQSVDIDPQRDDWPRPALCDRDTARVAACQLREHVGVGARRTGAVAPRLQRLFVRDVSARFGVERVGPDV